MKLHFEKILRQKSCKQIQDPSLNVHITNELCSSTQDEYLRNAAISWGSTELNISVR